MWLRSDIRRHSSQASAGDTRAAAQTSVMLIANQMPPRVESPHWPAARSACSAGQRTRAPSGEPARCPRSIVSSSVRACDSSAAPQRIAHGCTSSQQSTSPTGATPGAYARWNQRPFHACATRQPQLLGLGTRLARRGRARRDASPARRTRRSTQEAMAEFSTEPPRSIMSCRSTPESGIATSFQSALRMRTWPRSPRPTTSTKKRNWRRRCSRSGTAAVA